MKDPKRSEMGQRRLKGPLTTARDEPMDDLATKNKRGVKRKSPSACCGGNEKRGRQTATYTKKQARSTCGEEDNITSSGGVSMKITSKIALKIMEIKKSRIAITGVTKGTDLGGRLGIRRFREPGLLNKRSTSKKEGGVPRASQEKILLGADKKLQPVALLLRRNELKGTLARSVLIHKKGREKRQELDPTRERCLAVAGRNPIGLQGHISNPLNHLKHT